MKVYRIEGLKLPKKRRSLTLGSFDGVHLGHLSLLEAAKKKAKEKGMACSVVVFDPRPNKKKTQITSLSQQMRIFKDLGIDELFIMNFTSDLRSVSYPRFLSFLASSGVEDLVIGPFTRLGRGGEGTVEKMRKFCSSLSMNLITAAPVKALGKRVSSTFIRTLLEEGEVGKAATLLGRPHFIEGLVVRGLRNGRKIGFPTANLGGKVEGLVPAEGVYFGYFVIGSSIHEAAISVGTNPTVSPTSRELKVEAHLIGGAPFSLYGTWAQIRFIGRIRSQECFTSISQLREEIIKDVSECSERLHGA